jgi:hypothetical protein
MSPYRVFTFDAAGQILKPPEIMLGDDDREAIANALKFVNGPSIEVWKEDRLVVRLPCWMIP